MDCFTVIVAVKGEVAILHPVGSEWEIAVFLV